MRLAAVVVALVVLAGCASVIETPGPSGATGGQVTVEVTQVVDGDTVDVRYANGTDDTVRLVGVDTPEVHADNTPGEFEGVPETAAGRACLERWGQRASAFAKDRLAGERVTLAFDSNLPRRGSYGRLLAYVVVADRTFNYRLVASGYARVYDSDFSRADRYYRAESKAQSNGAGLWTCRTPESTGTPPDSGSSEGTPTPGADGVVVAEVRADAPDNDNQNLNEEYVVLENRGSTAVSIAGWTVSDEAGKTYTFGNLTLDPGASVTLHSGSGTDDATDVYWGRDGAVWNNGGDTVTVRDDSGSVVARKSY